VTVDAETFCHELSRYLDDFEIKRRKKMNFTLENDTRETKPQRKLNKPRAIQ